LFLPTSDFIDVSLVCLLLAVCSSALSFSFLYLEGCFAGEGVLKTRMAEIGCCFKYSKNEFSCIKCGLVVVCNGEADLFFPGPERPEIKPNSKDAPYTYGVLAICRLCNGCVSDAEGYAAYVDQCAGEELLDQVGAPCSRCQFPYSAWWSAPDGSIGGRLCLPCAKQLEVLQSTVPEAARDPQALQRHFVFQGSGFCLSCGRGTFQDGLSREEWGIATTMGRCRFCWARSLLECGEWQGLGPDGRKIPTGLNNTIGNESFCQVPFCGSLGCTWKFSEGSKNQKASSFVLCELHAVLTSFLELEVEYPEVFDPESLQPSAATSTAETSKEQPPLKRRKFE
jgi:hypothetical protein